MGETIPGSTLRLGTGVLAVRDDHGRPTVTLGPLATRAIEAVRLYEHWHAEVSRLTSAIGDCECPLEVMPPELEEGTEAFFAWIREEHPSHFATARERVIYTGGSSPEPRGGPSLAEIAKDVAECPSCSRLCALIAERLEAKKQRAAAKRRVRQVGKLAMKEVWDAR